jgi:AcrR family transcriptional regulator
MTNMQNNAKPGQDTRPHEMKRQPAKTPAPTPTPMGDASKLDGRFNRSVVTRKKIVETLSILICEGHISPTAEQVAQRAKVGLRTVFRHFDNLDALYREISTDVDAQIQPVLQARLDAATWQERVLQSIDFRSEIYDRTAALHVAAQAHRYGSAYLSQNLMDTARLQRELLQRLLPAAVAQNTPWLDALDLALSFESWIRLRREQGLPASQACAVMRLTAQALLATVAAAD